MCSLCCTVSGLGVTFNARGYLFDCFRNAGSCVPLLFFLRAMKGVGTSVPHCGLFNDCLLALSAVALLISAISLVLVITREMSATAYLVFLVFIL